MSMELEGTGFYKQCLFGVGKAGVIILCFIILYLLFSVLY